MRINRTFQKILGIFIYQQFFSLFEPAETQDFYSFILLSVGLITDICKNLSFFHFCESLMKKLQT